jgi:hypothetical protein
MNAKKAILSIVVAVAMATASTAWAQAQAPAGSTGQCKDDTYTNAASKRGACKGHGGVKEWYANEKSTETKGKNGTSAKAKSETPATTAATPAAPAATQPAPTKSAAAAERSTPAAGGGAGKVWVNTATNVYHCEGTRWYGKTKQGEYMTEAQAKAKGAHADHNKACG